MSQKGVGWGGVGLGVEGGGGAGAAAGCRAAPFMSPLPHCASFGARTTDETTRTFGERDRGEGPSINHELGRLATMRTVRHAKVSH